jgi:hypothetical protein
MIGWISRAKSTFAAAARAVAWAKQSQHSAAIAKTRSFETNSVDVMRF